MQTDGTATPAGFRQHASGLIVPAEVSRAREVWTWAEWRLLERATAFLEGKGLRVYFGCTEPGCRLLPIARVRGADGSIVFRCEHKDRVVSKGLK